MPHIVLEHSQNAKLVRPAGELLDALHTKLASFPTVNIGDIKSRIITHQTFRLADGTTDAGFVHLRLELMTGRDLTLRQEMGAALLLILTECFDNIRPGGQVSCSLEVREMVREAYFKTLTAGVTDVQ